MILKSVIYILPILIIQIAYGQPDIVYGKQVEVKIKVDRKYGKDAGEINFNVRIKNNSFKEYYVQDTLYMQRHVTAPGANFIWSYIDKKKNGKYIPGEYGYRGRGSLVPDSCSSVCCNCLLLKKGDFIQFTLALLKPYKLEKGEYRVHVSFIPPKAPPKADPKIHQELESNYVYFTIH